MKKLILVLVALIGLIGSVSADTLTKRWRDQTLTADVTVKSLNEKTTLDTAYSMVKDKLNRSVDLSVLRSGFIYEICERAYRLDKGTIHLIFLKNWKMNDDIMQASCIVWWDTNRKNWMYICLEEI
ncbi:MAG: hypothetical protein II411_03370 [Lachnospiraceae bacterium]|nr:hypothetical protein [Lachnospiraceae bacterium]